MYQIGCSCEYNIRSNRKMNDGIGFRIWWLNVPYAHISVFVVVNIL